MGLPIFSRFYKDIRFAKKKKNDFFFQKIHERASAKSVNIEKNHQYSEANSMQYFISGVISLQSSNSAIHLFVMLQYPCCLNLIFLIERRLTKLFLGSQ